MRLCIISITKACPSSSLWNTSRAGSDNKHSGFRMETQFSSGKTHGLEAVVNFQLPPCRSSYKLGPDRLFCRPQDEIYIEAITRDEQGDLSRG